MERPPRTFWDIVYLVWGCFKKIQTCTESSQILVVVFGASAAPLNDIESEQV